MPRDLSGAGVKPRLLDLFCGAGGAAMGYHRAGFEVVGVDIKPQPHYPFEFHQADAMTYPLDGFDAIHASPPCQAYSSATPLVRKDEHPDLYAPTRTMLHGQPLPFVIENVMGAPYDHGIILCGSMFGLEMQRHRNFETSWFMFQPPCQHETWTHRPYTISGNGTAVAKEYRHSNHAAKSDWPALMGMPWADPMEVKLAIPPAYTEWIGRQLIAAIERVAA
jgi:DNA (cytosine-5)-methyltransferase 1